MPPTPTRIPPSLFHRPRTSNGFNAIGVPLYLYTRRNTSEFVPTSHQHWLFAVIYNNGAMWLQKHARR
jgi:hypothetical protein